MLHLLFMFNYYYFCQGGILFITVYMSVCVLAELHEYYWFPDHCVDAKK